MDKFGSILAMFNLLPETEHTIQTIIAQYAVDYLNLHNLYYIATTDRQEVGSIITELNERGMEFVLFLNNIPTGSVVRSGVISEDIRAHIERILL